MQFFSGVLLTSMFNCGICTSWHWSGRMAEKKDYAAELQAMASIMEALVKLDREAQISVLHWVTEKLGLRTVEQPALSRDELGVGSASENGQGSAPLRSGNINTVAAKIGADSCRTVLMAAAIHLTLFQGRDSFTRSDLVSLARTAKIWKADYSNQTSTMISRLADSGILGEKGKGVYFLSDSSVKQYESAVQ
jgi:hypothetical protein